MSYVVKLVDWSDLGKRMLECMTELFECVSPSLHSYEVSCVVVANNGIVAPSDLQSVLVVFFPIQCPVSGYYLGGGCLCALGCP